MSRHGFGAAVLFASLLATTGASANTVCEIDGQAVDPANSSTTAGKTGVMVCVDPESRQVVREEQVRDGRFVGMRRFFVQGKLQREGEVNDKGNAQGRQREYALDGTVLRDAVYENGTVIGLALTYHLNGKLKRASFNDPKETVGNRELAFAEFADNGVLTELRCSGKPRLSPAVDDAKLCGFEAPSEVELRDASGGVKSRMKYERGVLVRATYLGDGGKPVRAIENSAGQRIERQFWGDGSLRREVQFEALGPRFERVREQEFAEGGKLQRDRHWREGQLQFDREYYLNGRMRREAERVEGQGIRVREYAESGNPLTEGVFLVEGGAWRSPIGSHKQFGPDGKLVSEVIYDSRGRSVREREWDASGKLIRDDEVGADGSRRVNSR